MLTLYFSFSSYYQITHKDTQDKDAKECCLLISSLAKPAFKPKTKTTQTKHKTKR